METNKKSNKIQIYKLLGAIPIKKKSKTLQTRLVRERKQSLAHDMRYVNKIDSKLHTRLQELK